MFNFRRLNEGDLNLVMQWRSDPTVSRFMQTDITPNIVEQKKWFAKVSEDPSYVYWVILYKDSPVGVLNLADVDYSKRECSWGFYLGDPSCRNMGGLLPPYLYNFLFRACRWQKLIADVMVHNHIVQKLHRLHGYKDHGLLPTEVIKGEQRFALRRYILDANTWLLNKRFAKFIAEFENPPQTLLS